MIDGKLLLTWFGPIDNPSVKLFKTSALDSESPIYEWPEVRAALFSRGGEMVVGTCARDTLVWDVNRGDVIAVSPMFSNVIYIYIYVSYNG